METGIKAFDSPELAALRHQWEANADSIEMRILEERDYPVLFVLVPRDDRWSCLRYFPLSPASPPGPPHTSAWVEPWHLSVDKEGLELIDATRWLASRPNRRV